jgi:tRNA A37 threonylcarbamoyladenosine synthetase subunit TsaC/SUA5/YrdC
MTALSLGRSRVGADLLSQELDRIVEHLRSGGILAYPTETVYGLGGEPTIEVVEAVRDLKGREEEKPFLLLLPRTEPLGEVPLRWGLSLPTWAISLAENFWPGPLTLVLSDLEERFPFGVRSSSGGVAVRVSSHPFVESLMALRVPSGPHIPTASHCPAMTCGFFASQREQKRGHFFHSSMSFSSFSGGSTKDGLLHC